MSILDWIEGGVNYVLGRESEDTKRNRQYAINDQMKAYREQSQLTQNEINKARESQKVEKRRINEKQIRSLRNNYRPTGGLLGQGSTLGSSGELPNKLGS